MKTEDYQMAYRLQERIKELDAMDEKLTVAWHAAQQLKNRNACEQLSELIYNLMQDHDGEMVVNTFVNHIRLKYDEWKLQCKREFEEL